LTLKASLESESRALEVTRKMFAALAHEKNVESEKAKAALSRCRKLESKLGLQLGGTGLARKLEENRRKLEDERSAKNKARNENKQLEDDLVRACSEIKVLERALTVKQTEFDEASPGSKQSTAPLREQLLYQLALKKEESHNLALELAHKTAKMKENDKEIYALQEEVHNLSVNVATSDAHVGHLTEQIIAQDLEMKNLEAINEAKNAENKDLLGHIERISKETAEVLQERNTLSNGIDLAQKRADDAEAALKATKANFQKQLLAAEKKVDDSKRIVKLAEERLRVEVNSRMAMGERAVAGEENGRMLADLQRDVELLRRGLGDEARAKQNAEELAREATGRCANFEGRERKMKEEMEQTLDALQRMTRERDAALQEVISLNSDATSSFVDRGEIERLATSKQLLQKALMEQLGNCKGQLTREREARMKLEDELRALKRGTNSPSPGAMMMASALASTSSPKKIMATAATPTGTIRTTVYGTPVTPALPERMLKIDVRRITGLPGRFFGKASGSSKEATIFLEFSSTGVVGTSTVDAVCTRPTSRDKDGDDVSFNQVLSMIISPSAVMKIQVYRGSPFNSHNEMIAYCTAPAAGIGKNGEYMELIIIEEGGGMSSPGSASKRNGRGGPRLQVQWLWSENMNSPVPMTIKN
jgi:hypothetical protein